MAIMCWVMVPLRGVGAVATLVRIRVITGDTKPSAAEMLCLCGGARASAAAPPHLRRLAVGVVVVVPGGGGDGG